MSKFESGESRLTDFGIITEVGDLEDPTSISWIEFPAVDFDPTLCDRESSVPVLTQDLLQAGVQLDKPTLRSGLYVFADVNVDGPDRGDVKPDNFRAVPEPTPEQRAESARAWRGEI